MVKVHQSILLTVTLTGLLSCGTKPPLDSTLLTGSTSESIGSIAAREQVLRGLMAGHNQQLQNAEHHFEKAYRFDPHPTIVQLRTQIQQSTMNSMKDPTPEKLK
jgi:hypothetical protein